MSKPHLASVATSRLKVAWGHLALLAVIALIVMSYLWDARGTSLALDNLLFVQPGALIALVLCLAVLPQCFQRVDVSTQTGSASDEASRQKQRNLINTGLLAASFGGFVTSLETIGFDVASWLFICVGLIICGERRWWVVLLFATVFTVLLIEGFRRLIPFPFPLRVL